MAINKKESDIISHKKNISSNKSAPNNQVMPDGSIIHKDNIDINNFIGQCFNNRYLIETHLSTGGMSEVFMAIDLELQNANIQEPYVALKILQSKFNDQFDAKKILIKESFKTQKLSHPNIIRVYSVGSHNEHHYMVMEWLDGESLDQLINRSKPYGITFNKAKSIIEKVSSGLKYAHSLGIIHTDLKPSNIFLTLKGEVKIFDFGVASSIPLNYNPYALEEKSETCAVEGHTPAYASLEQLNDKPPCIEDDVFAFSCIIYELISSKHPYKRIAMNKISKNDLQLIKPLNINLIQWRALKQGLAQKKVNRTVSIEKLEKQLNKKYFNKAISLILISSILIFSGYIYNEKTIEIQNLNQIIWKLKHEKARSHHQANSAYSEETQD